MNELNPVDRKALLTIARDTLKEYLDTGKLPPLGQQSAALRQPAGAFVTLKTRDGRLRGCIGTFSADTPIDQCVQQMAVSSATRDPRFAAVRPEELPNLRIEISVLSARTRVEDPEEVTVGPHGVCITHGYHHGVLLPQVATEHGWDRETFLDHLCLKAGLPTGSWREPESVLEVFTAQVFGEDDKDLTPA